MTLHDSFGILGTTISGKYQVEELVAEGVLALDVEGHGCRQPFFRKSSVMRLNRSRCSIITQ